MKLYIDSSLLSTTFLGANKSFSRNRISDLEKGGCLTNRWLNDFGNTCSLPFAYIIRLDAAGLVVGIGIIWLPVYVTIDKLCVYFVNLLFNFCRIK